MEASQLKEKPCMPRPRVSWRKRAVLSGLPIDQRPVEKVILSVSASALKTHNFMCRLNEYLDDLETSDPSERKLEKWFYTEWLARRQRVKGIAAANAAKRAAAAAALVGGEGTSSTGVAVKEREGVTVEDLASAEREVEQQELARELSVEREREIDRAVPMPSFFSLDNPVVIALSLALLGAAFGGLGR